MRTMYDSVTASNIPANAQMVAGYVDGRYAWTSADWARFSGVKVRIAVFSSTSTGDVIDCETGDATPAQAAAWVVNRRAAGYYRPTIYCDLSTVPAVRQATGALVLGRDYDIWVASYDGSTVSPYAGVAAKQYESTAAYDLSAVYDDAWPHRTRPAPAVFGPVRAFRQIGLGPHSFKASWSSPTSGPTGVGYYDFAVMNAAGTTVVQRHQVPKTTVSQEFQVNNLTPGTGYQAWIRACANGAESYAGPWSKLSFRTTS